MSPKWLMVPRSFYSVSETRQGGSQQVEEEKKSRKEEMERGCHCLKAKLLGMCRGSLWTLGV